jgi:hypothetical protein
MKEHIILFKIPPSQVKISHISMLDWRGEVP